MELTRPTILKLEDLLSLYRSDARVANALRQKSTRNTWNSYALWLKRSNVSASLTTSSPTVPAIAPSIVHTVH